MDNIVMYSSGIASWYAAFRLRNEFGYTNLKLLFADTKIEDEDNYRFINEASSMVGELVTIADGRNPWEVFKDEGIIGNSRVDPCSRILKRELCRQWVSTNYSDTATTQLFVGIDWTELDRMEGIRIQWQPYTVYAPLCWKPNTDKWKAIEVLKELNIKPPRLYEMGFPHANCGGFCIKTGKSQFAKLLQQMPDRYKWHEAQEEYMRSLIGDYSILTEMRNGTKYVLTLKEWRERLETGERPPAYDIGGCGCFYT